MKDMNDVVSYLNNVLGPCHDLTIAAREATTKQSNVNEETTKQSNVNKKFDIDNDDESQVVIWVLSCMIFDTTAHGGFVKWNKKSLPTQIKHFLFDLVSLDEVVSELEMDEKYPEESDELQQLGVNIEMMIDYHPDHVNYLIDTVQKDLVGHAFYEIFL